ncbi:hypothetical protein BD408DRAFT_90531 [Parasitella parasitica]|nr:hypothetical protein BD408DRAFT_90531 [Parasitella parasitica]
MTNESYLLKLPSEVLERIVDLSSLIEERNDEKHQFLGWSYPEHSYVHLKSIALCCRRLYILCAPFLWKDKEFILPRQDDKKSPSAAVQMATDILSKKALFQEDYYLGDYVRSLSRDLTSGPHFDLLNSKLMAQLVCNLRALRIDFHPLARSEHYGLRYFAEYCPQLNQLYLNQCRDTFNDFLSLVEHRPPLASLTLTNCTIKESTLEKLITTLKPTFILLQQVLIEPPKKLKTNSHLIDTTNQPFLHPFHYQDTQVSAIPPKLLQSLAVNNLSQLALTTDSITSSLLTQMTLSSPHLEKLSILLHELNPCHVQQALTSLSRLSRLCTLSLGFKRFYPVTKECDKLPCHAPSAAWVALAKQLPLLQLLYISASRLVVSSDFIPTLIDTCGSSLKNVIIHNLALTQYPHAALEEDEETIRDVYMKECASITYDIAHWTSHAHDLYTFEQAKKKGFDWFSDTDQVCYIKGFDSVE